MKKFVIIALIFALAAGAAFAQDWSVSGQGEIGTMLNFAGEKSEKDVRQLEQDTKLLKDNARIHALIGESGYHNIKYYGFIGGDLHVKYNSGGIQTGLDFFAEHGGDFGIIGELTYGDDTRAFQMKYVLSKLFESDAANTLSGRDKFADGLDRLWGHYKFLDGRLKLEAAVMSNDGNYWYSSNAILSVLGSGETGLIKAWGKAGHGGSFTPGFYAGSKGLWVDDSTFGKGFTDTDRSNFILVDVAPVDGLSLGAMVPSVFVFGANNGGSQGGNTQNPGGSVELNNSNGYNTWGYYKRQNDTYHTDFLDYALLHSTIGVKYGSGPINVAAQFSLLGRQNKYQTVTYDTLAVDGKQQKVSLKRAVPVIAIERVGAGQVVYPTTGFADPDKPTPAELDKAAAAGYAEKSIATGLYLGATYAISDSLNASFAFQGEFYSKKPELGFAATVGFSSGALRAGLGAGLFTIIDPNEDVYWPLKNGNTSDSGPITFGKDVQKTFTGMYDFVEDSDADKDTKNNFVIKKDTMTIIGVKPNVTFTLVENYLAMTLDSSLFWRLGVNNGIYERKYQENVFGYDITPQLWFNIMGTGVGTSYYSGNASNAIIVRYKVAGWVDGSEVRTMKKTWQAAKDVNKDASFFSRPMYNAVDITFKWAF